MITTETLTISHAKLIERRNALVDSATRAPEAITDDEAEGKMAKFVVLIDTFLKEVEATRKSVKDPYLKASKTIDAFFTGSLAADPKTIRVTAEKKIRTYMAEKAEAERKRQAAIAEEKAAEVRRAEEDFAQYEAEGELGGMQDAQRTKTRAVAAMDAADRAAKDPDTGSTDIHVGGIKSQLKRVWVCTGYDPDRIDLEALRRHFRPDDFDRAIRAFIRAGGRELAGAEIVEEQVAQIR